MPIKKTWLEFKNVVKNKFLNMQYRELDVEYIIWASEDGDCYQTSIRKSDIPDEDQLDFEQNYKDIINKPVVPKTPDSKTMVFASSRPENTYTVFLSAGDDIETPAIGEGKLFRWDYSNDDDLVSAPVGYKRKRIEAKFLDNVWLKDGAIYFFNMLKGSYVDFFIVCPAGQYYLDNAGNPKLATEDTKIIRFVVKHAIQDSCPMGDEVNSEAAMLDPLLPNYKIWMEITVPEEDVSSNGSIELELYRERSIIL